jgi:hypothetical protein
MATTNYNLPIINDSMTGDVPRDMNALANATDAALKNVKDTSMAAFTGDITKAAGSTDTAITAGVIVNADVNPSAAIDASKIGTGIVSNAEYGYLDGVTSGIQAQLNAKLATTAYTASDVLAKLLTVDGSGSGLDAALLHGLSPSDFVRSDTAFIELRNGSTTADAAYFDFHTSGHSVDFDSRIIASGGTGTGGSGRLELVGRNLVLTGNVTKSNNSQVEAIMSAAQLITQGVWTKVLFSTETMDVLGEYDTGLTAFTARDAGTYLFSVSTGIAGTAVDGARGILDLYVNGGAAMVRIADMTVGAPIDFTLAGAAAIRLDPGQTVSAYVYVTSTKNVVNDPVSSMIRIIKIA